MMFVSIFRQPIHRLPDAVDMFFCDFCLRNHFKMVKYRAVGKMYGHVFHTEGEKSR